jgi:zinc protease
MGSRLTPPYYATDLITEVMGNGFASRLYQRLVKEEQLFSNISCYHTGSLDAGLVVVEGKIREGKTIEAANEAVEKEIALLVADGVTDTELQKAKNKIEAMIAFEDMTLLSRANNIAFYELLGDAAWINKEWEHYQAVTAGLPPGNCKAHFPAPEQQHPVLPEKGIAYCIKKCSR